MSSWMLYIVLLLSAGITAVDASKILIIPYYMYSHVNIHLKLGKALQDDGHEVQLLAADKYRGMIEMSGLSLITYPLQTEDDIFVKIEELMEERPDGEGVYEQLDEYWLMSGSRICDSVMQNEYLMTTIGKGRFDLVVIDDVGYNKCDLMIPYIFDIPFVTMYGFQTTSWVSGVTGMPSIEPNIFSAISNRMDFWERIENLKSWLEQYDEMYSNLFSEHHMGSYCPAHKPKIPLKELGRKAEIFLVNFEIMCVDYPRVSAPNMQFIGGSTAIPAKPLPEDLETFMAGAEHGVVLMSMGSMKAAQYIWKIMGKKLFRAFGRLPQRVIAQYRLDEVHEEVPANLKLMKWIPQNDILGHPNVKLFITHGGNNGQNEAAYHGVPSLVIPMFNDQFYSGIRLISHGYGKFVKDKNSITSEGLYLMMTEIITNETYSKNIRKCSAIIHSMPSAQEKFVFWVNHILQFGGAHLRPPSLDMPLYQVLMLDIVAYYVVIALLVIHAAIILVYFSFRFSLKFFHHKRD